MDEFHVFPGAGATNTLKGAPILSQKGFQCWFGSEVYGWKTDKNFNLILLRACFILFCL